VDASKSRNGFVDPMYSILLLLILTTPAYANKEPVRMSCLAVRETAEVVLEAPNLSDRDKAQILRRLFGTFGVSCFDTEDANG
jgi:hypothetical protein